MEGLRGFITFRIRKIMKYLYIKGYLKMPQTLHYPPKEVYMKPNFKDKTEFARLEDKAIDGQLDYTDYPPAEYKYFSKLAKLGYNNRHKGWDMITCLKLQQELQSEYRQYHDEGEEYLRLCTRIQDNIKKSADLVRKMYKQATTKDEMLSLALQTIELLTNENGFVKRISEKIKEMKE